MNTKQKMLLVCAFVLTVGLISCSSDTNSNKSWGPTGMLVHEPIVLRRNGKRVALNTAESNKAIKLNTNDKMRLTPVYDNGRGLTTLQVQSACSVLNQPIGTDTVTLPYSAEYKVVQFFSAKTLLNDVWGGATELNCSMRFTISAANGSTHSFSLPKVHLTTEDSHDTQIRIFDVSHALSDNDGFLRLDYNHLANFRVQIQGVDSAKSALVCEVDEAMIQKDLYGSPLFGLQFTPRGGVDPVVAARKYASQQYCRLIVYNRASRVAAASNLILMTMVEPQFSVDPVATNYPNMMSSHNIFDYTWRNYVVKNHGDKTLYFAIPPLSRATLQFENHLFKDGSYTWAKVKIPTEISIHGPSTVVNGATTFALAPGQSVDVSISNVPHDFVCDQWRVPVMYSVQYDAKVIPIYQISKPTLSLAVNNILQTVRLERRFSETVTDDTFGDNTAYGNNCVRVMPNWWEDCYDNHTPSTRPFSQAIHDDNMCTRVD